MSKRPLEFKITVLAMYENNYITAKQAFRIACKKFNQKPSGCMTKYAGSYIRDYQNEIKAKLFDKDGRTMLLCKENGLYGF